MEFSDLFCEAINARVRHLQPEDPPNNATPSFESILGQNDLGPESLWWHLYIDPQDWDEAISKAATNSRDVGFYYNFPHGPSEEKEVCGVIKEVFLFEGTKGFQESMTADYKTHLLGNALGMMIHSDTYEDYRRLWKIILGRMAHNRVYKGGGSSECRASFGTGHRLAKDVSTDSLRLGYGDGKSWYSLVKGDRSHPSEHFMAEVKPHAYYKHIHLMCATDQSASILQTYVGKAFEDYHNDIAQRSDRNQSHRRRSIRNQIPHELIAIAKLVRRLHIAQVFNDDNDCFNLRVLLPALLLHHGFGLPFGGKNRAQLDEPLEHGPKRAALSVLFNGSFTVNEIARFLWVAQDFGLMNPEFSAITPPMTQDFGLLDPNSSAIPRLVTSDDHPAAGTLHRSNAVTRLVPAETHPMTALHRSNAHHRRSRVPSTGSTRRQTIAALPQKGAEHPDPKPATARPLSVLLPRTSRGELILPAWMLASLVQ